MWHEYNVVVLDVETLQSADDCRHCGQSQDVCSARRGNAPTYMHDFESIGWDNYAELGLSIGCIYSYDIDRYEFFDMHTLEATMRELVEQQPLLVSFNGKQFDGPLLCAVLHQQVVQGFPTTEQEAQDQSSIASLCNATALLWSESYDILGEIWDADPARKFECGLNSLGAISQANGYGAKEMDGTMAPRLWAQGHHAEVATYCMANVWKTRKLFEQIVDTGEILRGDGQPIRLRAPFAKEQK